MKKRTLSLITVAFGLCFLIFACRREINNFSINQPDVSSSLLESAKILNAKTLANNAAENKKTPGFFTLSPLWNKATILVNDAGTKLIIVPTIENVINNINVSIRRLYVFKADGDRAIQGRIVEFVGLDYSINKNLETLVKGMHSQSISGFDGAVIQYDLNYRWVSGTQYQSGTKIADNIALSKSIGGKNVYLSKIEVDTDGKSFFSEQKVLYDATKLRRLNEGDATGSMGQTSELSEVVIPGGGGNGGGGGYGGPFPDPPPVGGSGGGNGGTSEPPPPVPDPDNYYGSWNDIFWGYYLPSRQMPSYSSLYSHYPQTDNITTFKNVGGDVKSGQAANNWQNACALKISVALNGAGQEIPDLGFGKTFKGGDGKNYILSAATMKSYLVMVYGSPTTTVSNPTVLTGRSAMLGSKGIYVMTPSNSTTFGATGHCTLYNNGITIKADYLDTPSGVSAMYLWQTN